MDKYSATWVSHTSISDFKKCPRSYFLKHVYKDPVTGHKVKLMSPPLALGQSVHEVIESLSILPVDKRFEISLIELFENSFRKVSGKKGGFLSKDTERIYKERGEEMLRRVTKNPGPINRQAVKIKMDLPNFWLSEEENIILCGKIDWLEYLPESNGVHIVDFKTGKKDEGKDSLQLPIYLLLATNCQSRTVERASYWYLERSDNLTACKLPEYNDAFKAILEIARKIKLSRSLQKFSCPYNGCKNCKNLEAILDGKAELVGQDEYGADVYILKSENLDESEIL
jgi:ATP-dependent helicase/DNAse subunit B